MTNTQKPKDFKKVWDLEERTAKFGEDIIKFAKVIPVNKVTERLIPQLVGAGTSIGANYCEADDAESSKEAKELNLIFNSIYNKIKDKHRSR